MLISRNLLIILTEKWILSDSNPNPNSNPKSKPKKISHAVVMQYVDITISIESGEKKCSIAFADKFDAQKFESING